MSIPQSEVENLIALKFGQIKDNRPFSLQKLEGFVDKVQKCEKEHKQQQPVYYYEKSPNLICKNPICQNNDEQYFEKDEKMAQITCIKCGIVTIERLLSDSPWVRQIEGELNPSHHGPTPDARFSSSFNLSTGVACLPGSQKQAKDLFLIQKYVDMNLSNMIDGREGLTRHGYKDAMKKKIFQDLEEINEKIQLHSNVVNRAKTLFAIVRDSMEKLNDPEEYASACLIVAFREKIGYPDQMISPLVFCCKFCHLDFSQKRDKIFHENKCILMNKSSQEEEEEDR